MRGFGGTGRTRGTGGRVALATEKNPSGLSLGRKPEMIQILHPIGDASLQVVNYTIYNIVGQLMMEGKLQDAPTTINIEALPSGIYFLWVAGQAVKFAKQ